MITIIILAHRGTGKGPGENSLNAFIKGLDSVADGLELDIRMTKDRIPVCVHDESLERLYERDLLVNNLNIDDIREINLLNDDAITTLEGVFKRLTDKIFYDIEIKDPTVVDEFVKVLERFKITRLMVSSFKHHCLPEVEKKLSSVLIAPIINFKKVEDYKCDIQSIVDQYKPHSLNLDVRFFQTETVEKIEWFSGLKTNTGIKLAFWTVNTIEDFELIAGICDYLITDKPNLFKGVVQ